MTMIAIFLFARGFWQYVILASHTQCIWNYIFPHICRADFMVVGQSCVLGLWSMLRFIFSRESQACSNYHTRPYQTILDRHNYILWYFFLLRPRFYLLGPTSDHLLTKDFCRSCGIFIVSSTSNYFHRLLSQASYHHLEYTWCSVVLFLKKHMITMSLMKYRLRQNGN